MSPPLPCTPLRFVPLLLLALFAACGGGEDATNSDDDRPLKSAGKAGKGGKGGAGGGGGSDAGSGGSAGAAPGGSGGSAGAGAGGSAGAQAGQGGAGGSAGAAGAGPAGQGGSGGGGGGKACDFGSQCDDGNECTNDSCSGGFCLNTFLEPPTKCSGDTKVCKSGACVDPSEAGGSSGGAGAAGSGPAQVRLCSADLRTVTDEQGTEIEACPPDQGCAGGECVDACDAAAASQGSLGCDYWVPVPAFYQTPTYFGPCHAVFVVNAWPRPAKLTASRGGTSFDVTQFGRIPKGSGAQISYDPIPADGLPPGEVGILFLSASPDAKFGCPVAPALASDASIHDSGTGTAFRITSDTPLTAYDILPYGGASSFLPSATLLFPFKSWGTNYVVVAPHDQQNPSAGAVGQLWMSLVASADNTVAVVRAKSTLPAGSGVPAAPAGQPTTVTLSAGQVMQWMGSDPSSTVIESNQPIGLTTGTTYLFVPTATSPAGGGQDCAHQQLPPIKALGNEYVGPGIRSRLAGDQPESLPYRMLGLIDGTQLTWDPPVPNAPTQLNAGQVAEFETTSIFVVRSQDSDHPFALTQYMPGASPVGQNGDEEWVNVLPPAQFLSRYVFFTDPTYVNTNLVMTRKKRPDGSFADVTVACLGSPVSNWKAVDAAGDYQVAYVDLVQNGSPVGGCSTSRHEATSEGPFGVTVWGTSYYASYAYPAGGNLGAINQVVIKP